MLTGLLLLGPAPGTARAAPVPGQVELTLTDVSPPASGPGVPVTVSGVVRVSVSPAGPATTVRVIRGRSALPTRTDVDAWANATSPASGTEIGRAQLTPGATAADPASFRLVLAPEQLRSSASVAPVPLQVEILDADDVRLTWVHTFVGWSRPLDSPPLDLAWLLPLTLDPDPALAATSTASSTAGPSDALTAAWTAQLGPTSRLARILRATAGHTVGYAVDPVLVSGRSRAVTAPGEGATAAPGGTGDTGGDAAALRTAFAEALVSAAATHPILALPRGDADLSALLALAAGADATPPDVAVAAASLTRELAAADGLAARGIPVSGRLAWPAEGVPTTAEEVALRAAYGSPPPTLVLSAAANRSVRLTPPAAATTAGGTPALRYDDRLGALLDEGARAASVLEAQEFVAQSAALYAERPSVQRTALVVAAAGLDPDPEALGRFLSQADRLPWLRVVPVTALLADRTGGGTSGLPPAENIVAPGDAPASPVGAREQLAAVARGRESVGVLAEVLPPTSGRLTDWAGVAELAAGVRWREVGGRGALIDRLSRITEGVTDALSIAPLTTNFLADEGVLQVTVVNDLDEPVSGVHVDLAPANARLRVLEPPAAVTIGARSRAIVPVRVAAVAQGLVPVQARLTTASGAPLGGTQELSIRAAPPGAWLYLALGALAGSVLVAGIVRAVRRPRRPGTTVELDPILPTPETPLEDPVDTP